MALVRTLAAALAVAALAASPALAQPVDTHVHKPAGTSGQNLSSPDARDAASGRLHGRAPANARKQDLRHLRAGGAHPAVVRPQPPTWPLHPQPIVAPKPVHHGGGHPVAIGLGISGAVLAALALAGVAVRTRRLQRQRVPA
jgi:hypothetical protein